MNGFGDDPPRTEAESLPDPTTQDPGIAPLQAVGSDSPYRCWASAKALEEQEHLKGGCPGLVWWFQQAWSNVYGRHQPSPAIRSRARRLASGRLPSD